MIVPRSLIILSLAAIVSAQDTTIPDIPDIPSFDDNSNSGGEFTMPTFPGMPGVDETETSATVSSSSSNANAVCCNVKMGFGTCPSGLKETGGTLIGAGGTLTSCCPSGVTILSDNNPSCDGFVVKDTVPSTNDDNSGGSSSSGGNGVCSAELQAQFPTCDTCVYSCGDGEEKKCAFGFAGNCSPTCFGGNGLTSCTVPGAVSSGGGMDDMNFDNMNSSIKKDYIGIVLGMIWAIGYAIIQY